MQTLVKCKKKPGGPRNVTDQWCEDNCRGGQRSACVSSNRVDQKCVCSRDVTIVAKGMEGFEIFHRKMTENEYRGIEKVASRLLLKKILILQKTIYPWERNVRATPTRRTTIRVKLDGTALVEIIVIKED